MFNRTLKWLTGAALATAAVAAVPSFSEAHAHYTGTLPPSLMAMATAAPRAHALSHHTRSAKLTASKKAHKLSRKHHSLKKHRKSSAAKHKSL